MSRRFILVLLMIFWVVGLSPPVLAQGPPEKKSWELRGGRGMMGPMPSPMGDWASRLNLTEEQAAKIQELRESYLRDTLEWRNSLVIKRFDLRDLLNSPQADTNVILAKQREISDLESKIQERALLFQIEMRKGLTPQQIQLLPPARGAMYGPFMMPGRGRGMGREY